MANGHALLAPSGAERWWSCPGSVVLSEGFESKSSVHADEGTQAHALAEAILSGRKPLPPHTEEMLQYVKTYTRYVESVQDEDIRGVLYVEQQVGVTEDIRGTADALVWLPTMQTLHVIDLKYGVGVKVGVADNLQLKIYGLAALLTMKYPAMRVVVTIVQPRIPDEDDGCIRSKEYSSADLLDFYADLEDAAKRVADAQKADDLTPFLNPSAKSCRWCLGAPVCLKVKTLAQDAARSVFAPDLPYDPEELSRDLNLALTLEAWISNIREFAFAEARSGHAIPDWKIVAKRATRKWLDETIAAGTLQALHVDCFSAPSLKSPAAIEKLLPKDQRNVLDTLTVRESSGETLVPASDKREAVATDARSAFADEQ